jgi:hypothetical protein
MLQRGVQFLRSLFPDAALALEGRLLGGRTFYPSERTSADLAAPEPAQEARV